MSVYLSLIIKLSCATSKVSSTFFFAISLVSFGGELSKLYVAILLVSFGGKAFIVLYNFIG